MSDPAWLQARQGASPAAWALPEPGSAAVVRQPGVDAANPQETHALAVLPELARRRMAWEMLHADLLVRLVADFRAAAEPEPSSVPGMAATDRAGRPPSRATGAPPIAARRPVSMAQDDRLAAAFPETAAIPDCQRNHAPAPQGSPARRVRRPAAPAVAARHVERQARRMAADNTAETFHSEAVHHRPRPKRQSAKTDRRAR